MEISLKILINYFVLYGFSNKVYNIHHKTVFDTENLSENRRINIFQELQNDSLVRCIVKLITKTDGKNNFQIFENSIYSFFPTTVQKENLIEKAMININKKLIFLRK